MSTPTPSKLAILRAAGKVQRELEVEAEVHNTQQSNVTVRRVPGAAAVNPLDQLSVVQEGIEEVEDSLRQDEDLLRHLRQGVASGNETEFEDAQEESTGPERPAGTPDAADPPFSPDWFAKVIGAAVSAATSAAASSGTSSSSSKLKLSDRKLPDFWEWQPVAWFRLFDRHVAPFKPSQAQKFDALLPLLTTAACKHVQPVVRSPGLDPYTRAKTSLIRHFDKTPRDLARECRKLDTLGDMMPSDMLEHIYGLLPDPSVIYEVIFLDLLPPAARHAALQHSSLPAMATAADKIVLEGASASVSAVTAAVDAVELGHDVAAVSARRSPPRSRSRPRFLCSSHARWGRNSFRCADPSSCHMKDLVRPRQDRPPPRRDQRPSPGNGQAGGQ